MSENLEESLEQESKDSKPRAKRGIIIAGLCALSVIGAIVYSINNQFKPNIQKFSDFIRIDKKYPDDKEIIYRAYKNGREELTEKYNSHGNSYEINFEENNGDNELDRIEIKLQVNKYTEHITLYPNDYLNYPPFNRLGKQKLDELRKEFKDTIPFEKIKKKIE